MSDWSVFVSVVAVPVGGTVVAVPSQPPLSCCSPIDAYWGYGSSGSVKRKGWVPPRVGWFRAVVDGRDVAVVVDVVVAEATVVAVENSRAPAPEAESDESARPPQPSGAPPRCRDPPALRTLVSTGRRAMINPSRVSGRVARGAQCPPPRPWVPVRPRKQTTPRDPTCSASLSTIFDRSRRYF